MSHFPRIRTSGLWLMGGVLEASEMELFDAHLAKAINGDEGGVWAPSSAIEVGGSGFKVTGGFWSTGAFRVDQVGTFHHGLVVDGDDVSIAQDLAVQGDVAVTGAIHADGLITSDAGVSTHGNVSADGTLGCDGNLGVGGNAGIGGTCMVVGNTTLGGTLGVTGAVGFSSTLAVGGTIAASADVNVGGALSVNDLATFTERVTCNGGLLLRTAIGSSTNASYSVSTVDEVLVGQTGLSTDVIYTLLNSGAVDRSRIRFTTHNASHNVTVAWTGGSTNMTFASGSYMTVELVYLSGSWYVSLLVKA